MDKIDQITNEEKLLLKKISKIESMRKGTISKQNIKTPQKDGSVKENGPYYVLTSKDPNGKTLTESVPKEKLEFFKQEINNYKEFKDLTNKYEALAEESSKIKSKSDNPEQETLKKNRKSK